MFKDYNFEQGGYSILGTFSRSDRNSLQDSLGEFYTDEIAILNQFKAEWTFSIPGKKFACGYHYRVFLCKNGSILKEIRINLNCNEIVSDEGYFYFDNDKLSMFYGKMNKPSKVTKQFKDILKARAYRDSILNIKRLIMTPSPSWTTYEGEFYFEYECEDSSTDCLFENTKRTLKTLDSIIRRTYPNETFELQEMGGSLMTIRVQVQCNKSLSDKFKLFNRGSEQYFEKFTPYRLKVKSYWRK
ncbi:MAG: hypothetical protein COA58_01075 [Bacteroidetes bacterium]|nr:MAG: hypothetical protein COA58_01075 [Bacteroidota bacterium]